MQWKKINPFYHITKYLNSNSKRSELYEHQRCVGDVLQLALREALKYDTSKRIDVKPDNKEGYCIIISKKTIDDKSEEPPSEGVLELIVVAMNSVPVIMCKSKEDEFDIPLRVENREAFLKNKNQIVNYAKKF